MAIHAGDSFILWQRQLRLEFDQIAWQFGIRNLQPPMFEIVEVHSYWGQWDPVFRRIRLSAHLIESHPWDFVLKILKHEMAHQIVSEIFAIENDSSHGESFRRACRMLGLEEEFQGYRAHAPSPEVGEHHKSATDDVASENFDPGSLGPDDPAAHTSVSSPGNEATSADELPATAAQRLLERTKRLMALAQSANEHEALASMRKVYELYEKYNLEKYAERIKAGDRVQQKFIYKIIYLNSRRIEAHQSHIASLLQEFYFVQIVFSEMYDANLCIRQKTIELFGSEENVAMAEYVFHFLENQVLQMWRDFSRTHNRPVKFKRSYLVGLLVGFRDKLRSIQNSLSTDNAFASVSISKSKALQLLAKDPQLQEFISQRIPRLSRRSSAGSGLYTDVFTTGKSDGHRITIHKGLENAPSKDSPLKFLKRS